MLVESYLLLFLKKQLLPFNTNKYSKGTSTKLSNFHLFAKFTNLKAMLSSARTVGLLTRIDSLFLPQRSIHIWASTYSMDCYYLHFSNGWIYLSLTWMLGKKFLLMNRPLGFKETIKIRSALCTKLKVIASKLIHFVTTALHFSFTTGMSQHNHGSISRKGLSPLHSWVMALVDTFNDTNQWCGMDSLYNSVAFCKAAKSV